MRHESADYDHAFGGRTVIVHANILGKTCLALLDEKAAVLTDSGASHLLRRAGFGGSPADRVSLTGLAAADAVAQLVDVQATDPFLDRPGLAGAPVRGVPLAELPDEPVIPGSPTRIEGDLIELKKAEVPRGIRAHWLYRMRYSSQPFQEQFTLFLHDHAPSDVWKIASNIPGGSNSGNDGDPMGLLPAGQTQRCDRGVLGIPYDPLRNQKIATAMLKNQNDLYRSEGLNGLDDLLMGIVRDPAMLSYLDNFLNVKGKPQENLARELMELFSLGVGNYSENDVQEIAKVLTGEGFSDFSCDTNWNSDYGFTPAKHESGGKSIFGSVPISFSDTGQETIDVVQAILTKRGFGPSAGLPATAVYISWKLCQWFVNESIQLDPPDPIVLELATYLSGDDGGTYPERRYPYDMKAAMGTLLRSRFFFQAANVNAIHKHPADYLIGTLRALELPELFVDTQYLISVMGMNLFQPPDVGGWHHGRNWLGAATLIARYNWAHRLTHWIMRDESVVGTLDAMPVSNSDHSGIIDFLADALFHGPLTAQESGHLSQFLAFVPMTGLGGDSTLEKRRKIENCVHLMLTMPRVHLK